MRMAVSSEAAKLDAQLEREFTRGVRRLAGVVVRQVHVSERVPQLSERERVGEWFVERVQPGPEGVATIQVVAERLSYGVACETARQMDTERRALAFTRTVDGGRAAAASYRVARGAW